MEGVNRPAQLPRKSFCLFAICSPLDESTLSTKPRAFRQFLCNFKPCHFISIYFPQNIFQRSSIKLHNQSPNQMKPKHPNPKSRPPSPIPTKVNQLFLHGPSSMFYINLLYNLENFKRSIQMRVLQRLKETIKMGDFFHATQMLRYEQQSEYRTFTGGLISLGIITTIIIAFASMIIDTMNRNIIEFTEKSERQVSPPLSTITASADDHYMFGVEVWGYNLSSEYRYFDVIFYQIQSHYGENYTYTQYPLEPCTREHWAMLPEVVQEFDGLSVGNWLCPTIGTIIKLQGKYSSEFYNQYSVTLLPCSNQTDPLRPCAPQQKIDQYFAQNGQWNYFTYYHVNTIINPDQPNYIAYYLEDRHYVSFGTQLGAEMQLYLNEFSIESDNSIWPFSDIVEDKAYYIDFSPILYPFVISNQTSYASFYVMKDPTQHSYIRSVQKIFVVFSFMGGLIGAVMAGLFIVNTYTTFAFEVALAIQIFKDQETSLTHTHKTLKQDSKGSINVLHFIKYNIYQFIKIFKPDLKWQFVEYIDQCRNEILYQLDIKGLIKRIIFLQYSISYIFEDFHLAEMHNQKPYLPADVKKLRELFSKSQATDPSIGSSGSSEFIQSNKPLHVQPDHVRLQSDGISSQQFDTVRQHQSIHTINPRPHTSKINIESIDENGMPHDETQHELRFIKKRTMNIKKLTQSAKQGNAISKKLLTIIASKPDNIVESLKEIQKTMIRKNSIIA